MNTDLEVLRDMIREDALVEPVAGSRGARRCLVLKETQRRRSYEVEVKNIPDDAIAFKADRFPGPDAIFKCQHGECKRADFVLIARAAEQNWIIYVEMKGGDVGSREEVERQLKGAECVLEYCRSIGRKFWATPDFLDQTDYQQRFVAIKNLRLDKRPTRKKSRSGAHDTPENMLIISSGRNRVEFGQLVDG